MNKKYINIYKVIYIKVSGDSWEQHSLVIETQVSTFQHTWPDLTFDDLRRRVWGSARNTASTLRSTPIWGQLGQVNSKTVFYHQMSRYRWIWSIFSVLQLKKIANPPRPQRQNDIWTTKTFGHLMRSYYMILRHL